MNTPIQTDQKHDVPVMTCPDCGAEVPGAQLAEWWLNVPGSGLTAFVLCPVCTVGSPAKAWRKPQEGRT